MKVVLQGTALLFAAWVALGCDREPQPSDLLGEARCAALRVESPLTQGNLVLVLNDAMRRDFPGVYGGVARTPHLDALAAEHLTFDRAVTQSPWTKPAVATLFTSLYPSQHRVASHPQLRRIAADETVDADVLASSVVTLAEVLRDAGMRTAAFVANPWLAARFQFDQGFEVYDDSFARWGTSGDAVIDAGLAWLEALGDGERAFLYLHTIESHRPYGRLPGEDLDAQRAVLNRGPRLTSPDGRGFAGRIRLWNGSRAVAAGFAPTASLVRAAYRSGVEDFDAILGRLLTALREGGAWDRTALIVTSDHGESLFKRGYGNHGGALFDDEAAIPLVARLPGVVPERGRVACLVGLVDLMPSLCSYLDARCPDVSQGWSFLPRRGAAVSDQRRYLVTEGVMNAPANRSLRNRRFKLLFEPGDGSDADGESPYSLFDLEADPAERRDRLEPASRTDRSDRAFEVLREAVPHSVAALPAPEGGTAEVDPELRERLRALGYGE